MDLIMLLILGLHVAGLLFFIWYLAEKCFTAYDARKTRAQRRVQFQSVWRSKLTCNDELDYIITRDSD